MYESYYQFREKPFSLLPDAGFLFLSNQHRMALTLLEYGLMNQAGFTVISGDIGTGKTTLIRQVLNNIDPLVTVGLISNTHQTFGDLMQWIALAFDLPRQGRDKVQLYHDFMEFIIQEYGQGRRTVLIVDEAQNMSAETLEELRMLSNVNADKDQVLQIILVGQRELRETLQRPDLVQFAQRIGVDYHLQPLTAAETGEYIQHRCRLAGGNPELFTEQARQAVYACTGGIPRLINLLCDTALVYGYAEQHEVIDEKMITDAARDKQQGGLFAANAATLAESEPVTATQPDNTATVPGPDIHRHPAPTALPVSRVASSAGHDSERIAAKPAAPTSHTGKLRVAIAAESELLRAYLAKLMSRYDIQVVEVLPLQATALQRLQEQTVDVLLVELDDHLDHLDEGVYELLDKWEKPVLFNDSLATEASLSQPNRLEYGLKLSQKLYSLVPQAPQSVA
jgi:type II secretory pathway predicted ATPase ExeA